MESQTKVMGHAAHPISIVFPLGLLATSVLYDLRAAASGRERAAVAADAMLGAGLVGGLVAAPLGYRDWRAIPDGTRAKEIGRWHGLGNVAAMALFGASWLLRRRQPEKPGALAVALSVAAAGVASVSGWLGGELIERLGVGVDEGAHLDAPSSLTGPAVPDEASASENDPPSASRSAEAGSTTSRSLDAAYGLPAEAGV